MPLNNLPVNGLLALCDDLRHRAPKQTALTVRYLITILNEPGLKVSEYHLTAASNSQYGHGNTILKGLHDLGYIELSDPENPAKGRAEITEFARTTLELALPKHPVNTGVELRRHPDRLCVTSPYHPALPGKAHELKGRWIRQESYWEFPVGIEPAVRELYMRIYGEYDVPAVRTTIICNSPFDALRDADTDNTETIFIAGREVASITKQGRLRLGQGVRVQSGGMVIETIDDKKKIVSKGDTTIHLDDVPLAAAEQLQRRAGDQVRQIDPA